MGSCQSSSPPSSPDLPTTPLYQLIHERCYSKALERLKNHPHEALRVDENGESLLVKLILESNTSTQAVTTLINVIALMHPELVVKRDRRGLTPLHLCVRTKLPRNAVHQWTLALIHGNLNAISERDSSGYKPFHLACQYVSDTNVLRVMLESDPSLAIQRSDVRTLSFVAGYYPVELIWRNKYAQGNYFHHEDSSTLMAKMAIVSLTALKGRLLNPLPMQNLLHAACHQPCPLEYFSLVLREMPLQVSERDDRGNLPLHYAVRQDKVGSLPPYCFPKHLRKFCQDEFRVNAIFEELLQAYPVAATKRDGDGRLPLHVALDNPLLRNYKDVIQMLISGYPEALRTMDTIDGLYPVLKSAKKDSPVSDIFELLQAAPDVVLGALAS